MHFVDDMIEAARVVITIVLAFTLMMFLFFLVAVVVGVIAQAAGVL